MYLESEFIFFRNKICFKICVIIIDERICIVLIVNYIEVNSVIVIEW